MSKLKPYKKYKDSGVECLPAGQAGLGEIPEGWKVRKLRRICRIINGSTPSTKNGEYWNGNVQWITPADLGENDNKYIEESERKISNKGLINSGAIMIPKGSVILSTRAPIGHISLLERASSFNQGCKGLKISSSSVNPEWLYYFLWSNKKALNTLGRGSTFTELSSKDLKDFIIILPSMKDQNHLVSYLNIKISQINKYIKKLKKEIALLKEYRQKIISQAVTCGLTEDGKLRKKPEWKEGDLIPEGWKDSGVECLPAGQAGLGLIPEGWEVRRLKYLANVSFSSIDKHVHQYEEKVHVCDYTNVYYGEKIKSKQGFRKGTCSKDELEHYHLRKGDVIITKDSETADDIGVPAYIDMTSDDVVCGYHLSLIRYHKADVLNSEFLFRLMQSERIRDYFEINANGVTRFGLGKNDIQNLYVVIPKLDEQAGIVDLVEYKTIKVDRWIEEIREQIELIKEYKQSLISKVVTGKVDVRNINN